MQMDPQSMTMIINTTAINPANAISYNNESHTTFCAISSVARLARAGETPLCVSVWCLQVHYIVGRAVEEKKVNTMPAAGGLE